MQRVHPGVRWLPRPRMQLAPADGREASSQAAASETDTRWERGLPGQSGSPLPPTLAHGYWAACLISLLASRVTHRGSMNAELWRKPADAPTRLCPKESREALPSPS